MVWRGGPTGVGERGTYGEGSPGTWEASTPPLARAVQPSEGNEAEPRALEESEQLVVADEAGEPTRGTPWREGAAGTRNRTRER